MWLCYYIGSICARLVRAIEVVTHRLANQCYLFPAAFLAAMRLGFRFSNLLGSVYGKGNVIFSPKDGNKLFSPGVLK